MPERLARLICRLVGHQPKHLQTAGYVDGIELVRTGRHRVPMRAAAELDYCTRCGCRRLALDPMPLRRSANRHLVRWVAP
jgi:hypothetical protein